MKKPLVYLASASPRRVMLLNLLKIPFRQIVSDVKEETSSLLEPEELALINSKLKINAVLPQIKEGFIIGADTIVVMDDQIFGKPENTQQAIGFLTELSGNTHKVITGVSLCDAYSGDLNSKSCITQVTFRKIHSSEIQTYIHTGEPFDKAGGYAIQGIGAAFIESVQGCYSNVIGLPLVTLQDLFSMFDISLITAWKESD